MCSSQSHQFVEPNTKRFRLHPVHILPQTTSECETFNSLDMRAYDWNNKVTTTSQAVCACQVVKVSRCVRGCWKGERRDTVGPNYTKSEILTKRQKQVKGDQTSLDFSSSAGTGSAMM